MRGNKTYIVEGESSGKFLVQSKRGGGPGGKDNLELYNLYNKIDVVTFIKLKKLEWVGRIIRACESRGIKKIINAKPEGVNRGL